MKFSNDLTNTLNIRFPLVMAPMFLVTTVPMVKEAVSTGILGCFPSLNFRNEGELENVLDDLNQFMSGRKGQEGNYGVNIIVQKANPWSAKHLAICLEKKVPVFITSLGNPAETIKGAHAYGGKVFCDVTNLIHAKKCADLGCDGFVAVGQGAGGHAGPYPVSMLIQSLKKEFPKIPILAAGGIANGATLLSAISAGASVGYSGTRFIASTEATVSKEYKDAIVNSNMEDIVLTERISGTPCTIINTEFAKKLGTEQNWFEKWMSRNPRTKKYFKMLIQRRGFTWLEDAVKPGNYNNLWCAGQTVELIHKIQPIKEIVTEIEAEFFEAYTNVQKQISN
jgi:nitronate monooxygenase